MSSLNICPNCGAENQSDQQLCSKCGKNIIVKQNSTAKVKKPLWKRPPVIAAIFGALVVVIYIPVAIKSGLSAAAQHNPFAGLAEFITGLFLVPGFLVVLPLLTWLITFIIRKNNHH